MSNDLIKVDNTVALARAEIDIQVSTAKAYPRDLVKCFKKALDTACFSREIAESCMYRKPVGNKGEVVTGESIRLAEIMVSAWGNIHCSTRLVRNDGKFISVEAVVIDRETNNVYSETVERSIMTTAKNGQTPRQYSYDMIQNTAAAGASIALRKAAFRLFGKQFVEVIYNATRDVATGVKPALTGQVESMQDIRKKALEQFNKNGITSARIFNYFDIQSVDQLNQDHIEEMISIRNEIREGTMKKDHAFDRAFIAETGEVLPTKADEANQKLIDKTDELPYI